MAWDKMAYRHEVRDRRNTLADRHDDETPLMQSLRLQHELNVVHRNIAVSSMDRDQIANATFNQQRAEIVYYQRLLRQNGIAFNGGGNGQRQLPTKKKRPGSDDDSTPMPTS